MVRKPVRQKLHQGFCGAPVVGGYASMQLDYFFNEVGMDLPVAIDMTRVNADRCHQGFFLGKVIPGVVRKFAKYRLHLGGGRSRLPHDQIAEVIDETDQVMVLLIDILQPGKKARSPLKCFHEIYRH
jgi:hypothetical protein